MSDLLSQAEIDALLKGMPTDNDNTGIANPGAINPGVSNTASTIPIIDDGNTDLAPEEADVLGEVGNISMGSSATALSTLINQTVTITTPKVDITTWEELMEKYPKPYVVTKVEFSEGLIGSNLLIMKVEDIKILTNLMIGEEASNSDEDLTELQLSATGEAMNQMIGSACTSISSMVGQRIDITPPSTKLVNFSTEDRDAYGKIYGSEKIVKVSFRMIVGNLIDSEIMQLLPISFAKSMVKCIFSVQNQELGESAPPVKEQPVIQQAPPQPQVSTPSQSQPNIQQSFVQPQSNYQEVYQQPMNFKAPEPGPRTPVNVQPVQFQSLEDPHYASYRENISLIMDVPLQVTVELGRATKMIREILEFGPGSIVELDKLAGEPVDILVNGKVIAKGEVVVIDESFGVRITDIVHPSKRI